MLEWVFTRPRTQAHHPVGPLALRHHVQPLVDALRNVACRPVPLHAHQAEVEGHCAHVVELEAVVQRVVIHLSHDEAVKRHRTCCHFTVKRSRLKLHFFSFLLLLLQWQFCSHVVPGVLLLILVAQLSPLTNQVERLGLSVRVDVLQRLVPVLTNHDSRFIDLD